MTSAAEEKLHRGEKNARSCLSCRGQSFRRSRLKVTDLWSLLALHYPVRCLSCSKRQVVPLGVAGRALSSKAKHVQTPESGAESIDGDAPSVPRKQPSTVGGAESWSMPVHTPMTMPDLHGVTLKHTSSTPIGEERHER